MTKRQCGSCTACCEGWLSADELDMYPGRPCRHCTQQGCAIYESRPADPCVRFECAWLQEHSPLPEELRPDRSGVIVLFDREWRGLKVVYALPAGQSVPPESLELLRTHAQRLSLPLVFHERILEGGEYIGVKVRGFGPPAFAEAVRTAIGPEDIVKM